MKVIKILLLLYFGVAISSCGTKKNATNSSDEVFSKADYAYIEKFHESVRLKSKGQFAESIQGFEHCLSMRQNDDAVHYALSQLFLIQGNAEKSGESIKKAAKIDPNNLHYTSELAYFYIEKQQFNEAIALFEKLVKNQPRNPDVLYPYAECLVRAGKPQQAIDQLNRTEDQIGVIPEISIQKYQLYRQLKEDKKAINEIEKARKIHPEDAQLLSTLVDYYYSTKQNEKALITLEELAKSDPSNGRVHLFIADVYRQKEDKNNYFPALKKAFLGEGVDVDTKMKILVSLQVPGEKIDPRAMELAEIFANQNPESAKAFSVMGDYLLDMKREDEALVNYKKALQFEKGAHTLWNQVLIMEYQSQKFDELVVDSDEAIKHFPNSASFYLLNGVGNVQVKKYQEAIDVLLIGIEYATNDKPLQGEFFGQLGEAYFGKKEITKGHDFYLKAIEKDSKSSLLLNNYAFRLATDNLDLIRAESLIKKANEFSPNQPQFLDTYGLVMFKKGDFLVAMAYFEKAYLLDNEDVLLLDHLGDAAIKLNKLEDALKYWNLAKKLGSKNKAIDKKIENNKYYEPVF